MFGTSGLVVVVVVIIIIIIITRTTIIMGSFRLSLYGSNKWTSSVLSYYEMSNEVSSFSF